MNEMKNGLAIRFYHGSVFKKDARMMANPEQFLNSFASIVQDPRQDQIGWIPMWVGEPPGEWREASATLS